MGENFKYHYEYPHPAVTTDCVIFGFDSGEINVLLVERGIEPYKGQWALPGGFVRMHESAEECARRELAEETGIAQCFMEQLHAFSSPERDPRERVITIAFYALVRMQEVRGGDDAARAEWFAITQMPQLAFDHDEIVRMALDRLRERIHFKPIGFELLRDTFTMTELQQIYEAILGTKFDRRNFAKKMLHSGVLEVVEPTAEPKQPRRSKFWHKFRDLGALTSEENDDEIVDEIRCSRAAEPWPPIIAAEPAPPPAPPARRSVGTRYRFNEQSYDELKSQSNRLEF